MGAIPFRRSRARKRHGGGGFCAKWRWVPTRWLASLKMRVWGTDSHGWTGFARRGNQGFLIPF